MHAVATFSEFFTPSIGSSATASTSSSTWGSTPMLSLPRTSASGEGIGSAVYSRLLAVVSAAHTVTPRARSSRTSGRVVGRCEWRTRSAEPRAVFSSLECGGTGVMPQQ